MMEWALAILFILAAGLLIFSMLKLKQSSKKEQREMDTMYFSMMNEIKELQNEIRNLKLDMEIIQHEASGETLPPSERLELREMLDLFKRGYSIQSIADQKKLDPHTVEQLLAPFKPLKKERGKEKNAS